MSDTTRVDKARKALIHAIRGSHANSVLLHDGRHLVIPEAEIDELGGAACATAEQHIAQLRDALKNLFALVEGEAPSILRDDHHYELVRAALEEQS